MSASDVVTMTVTTGVAQNGMQTLPAGPQTTLKITATAFQAPWVTAHISVPFPSNYARQTQLAYNWPDPPQWTSGSASSLGGTEATSGIVSVAAAATAAGRAVSKGSADGSAGRSGGFHWPVWATAAIAGGGGFILLMAILLAFCCYRKKRNQRRRRNEMKLPPAAPGRHRNGTRKSNYATYSDQEKRSTKGEKLSSYAAAGMASKKAGGTRSKPEERKGYRNSSAGYPPKGNREPQAVFGAGHPYRETPTNSSTTLYDQPRYPSDPFRASSPAGRGYSAGNGPNGHRRVASQASDDGFYGEPQPGFGEESYSQHGSPARLLPTKKNPRSHGLYQDSSVPPSPVYDSHQDAGLALGAAMMSGNHSNENLNSIRSVDEPSRANYSNDDVRNRAASPIRSNLTQSVSARTMSPVGGRGSRQSYHDAGPPNDHGHIEY